MLFLFCVFFVVFTTGRFVFSLALLFVIVCFSVLFSIVITSLWEDRELVYVFFVHVFVCFARIHFCTFSLLLGVRNWLRLVIVAPPGLFY